MSPKLLKRYSQIAALAVITGCGTPNPYAQFFHKSEVAIPPKKTTPRIYAIGSDMQRERINVAQNGYALIGESSFTGPMPEESKLMAHASAIGADIILLEVKSLGSATTALPFVIQEPDSITVQQTYGVANGQSYSRSTVRSQSGQSHVAVVPVTYERYAVDATFWRDFSAFIKR